MTSLWQILTFRRMISPLVLQVLFWGGIGGTLYGTYVLIKLGHWAWPFSLVFGTLAVRVFFEGAIVVFQANDRLSEIRDELSKLNRGA